MTLAATLALPRTRERIRRSRGPVAQDQEIQLRNGQRKIALLEACGLCRAKALALRVQDIRTLPNGQVEVHVRQGKGGRSRMVPVMPGHEQEVLAVVAGRGPEEQTLERLPVRLDGHSLRRVYAQALYLYYAPGWKLPPPEGRLKPTDDEKVAAKQVSHTLGHSRLDVVLTHSLR